MEIDLGDRANCINLIPLYEKNYEEMKNDGIWLQRALNRLFNKECVDSELFVKILQQKNSLEPDASTSYYLGIIKDKEGKSAARKQIQLAILTVDALSFLTPRNVAKC